MTRTYGWSQRGEPKTLTFLGGLRRNRIIAPFVLDGPINSLAFTAWVEQSLVRTLKPHDIVILDNLGSHKGKPVRDAISDVGAHLFFLPPYSPDLNPIEMMFAKLKALVRKAEERTVETTWRRIGKLLTAFSTTRMRELPQACRIWFKLNLTDSSRNSVWRIPMHHGLLVESERRLRYSITPYRNPPVKELLEKKRVEALSSNYLRTSTPYCDCEDQRNQEQ